MSSPRRDDGSASPSGSQANSDPYYTNQDIIILHAVVWAAQNHLDLASDPKPLPAAALFKAYDEVLPQYGIDPDQDNHLSALVFRVGGEHGESDLTTKFQSILGRMGISLEYGDDVSATGSTTEASFDIAKEPYPARVLRENNVHHTHNLPNDEQVVATRTHKTEPATNQDRRNGVHNPERKDEASPWRKGAATSPASKHLAPSDKRHTTRSPKRAAVFSAIEHWHNAALKQKLRRNREAKKNHDNRQHESQHTEARPNPGEMKDRPLFRGTETAAKPATKTERLAYAIGTANEQPVAIEGAHKWSITQDDQDDTRDALGQMEIESEISDDNRLLQRALRAREIYLTSKALNYWANKVAVRAEREAVARRHMLRYRCFRGWSHVPSANFPIVTQLQALTAIQKLNRAINIQKRQLSEREANVAGSFRIQAARRTCGRWRCLLIESTLRQRYLSQRKINTVAHWASFISMQQTWILASSSYHVSNNTFQALKVWQISSAENMKQLVASQQLRAAHSSGDLYDHWRNQTHVVSRMLLFRQYSLVGTAHRAVDKWMIQARSEAYAWKCQQKLVWRVVRSWSEHIEQQQRHRYEARAHFTAASAEKLGRCLQRANTQLTHRKMLQKRALLYIRAKRTVKVLTASAARQEERTRIKLRQYLMTRYKEVSSARRARSFYQTLNRWSALSARAQDEGQLAQSNYTNHRSQRVRAAARRWMAQIDEHRTMQLSASRYLCEVELDSWHMRSLTHRERTKHMSQAWTTERQLQCLKLWTNFSLQRSGHAHTSAMVHDRHSRDMRNRTLHHWRRYCSKSDQAAQSSVISSPRTEPVAKHRSIWKGSSAQRIKSQSSRDSRDYPPTVQTPTRWTGSLTPIGTSTSIRPMPMLKEAEEATRSAFEMPNSHPGFVSSSRQPRNISIQSTMSRLSTTPSAPVPAHIEQDFQSHYKQPPLVDNKTFTTHVRGQHTPRDPTLQRSWMTTAPVRRRTLLNQSLNRGVSGQSPE